CDKHPTTFVCPVVDAGREDTCYWIRSCGSRLDSRKLISWHSFEKILLINDHAEFLQKFPKPEMPCMVGAIPCGCPGSGLIGEQGLAHQRMHRHMAAINSRQLLGQRPKMAGLYTIAIDKTGNFHTAIGQIVNQASITHIAVDDLWTLIRHCLDDIRAVFVAPL